MEIAGTGASTHGTGKAQNFNVGQLGSTMCVWNRGRFQPKILEGTLG